MVHVDRFSIDRTVVRLIVPAVNSDSHSDRQNRGAGPCDHRHDESTIAHRMTQ